MEMKLFFKNLVILSLIVVFIFGGVCYYYSIEVKSRFKLPQEIKVLILGDSHTQSGLDDRLIQHAVNFSSSGEHYAYVYEKLKYITRRNTQIQTVILAFSGSNFIKERDEYWLFDNSNLKNKFGTYFPIFSKEGIQQYLKVIPLQHYAQLIDGLLFYPMYSLEKSILVGESQYIGGYFENNQVMEVEEQFAWEEQVEDALKEQSVYQLEYFAKIQEYCIQHGIDLMLINTPVFNAKSKDDIEYLIHPHSIYLDFKTLPLPADHFADASHLNPKGAQVLSEKVNQILYKVE